MVQIIPGKHTEQEEVWVDPGKGHDQGTGQVALVTLNFVQSRGLGSNENGRMATVGGSC